VEIASVGQALRTGYNATIVFTLVIMVLIALSIYLTVRGVLKPKIRRLPGIDAIDEAIGRATELRRPVHFCMGQSGISGSVALAALAVLRYTARKCAEMKSRLIFSFAAASVNTVAADLIKQAYIEGNYPEGYRPEDIRWLSERQFAYSAGVLGLVLREKPAANLFFGFFMGEALLFAESGYRVGAIQIAGTTMSIVVPFFVVSCDYTLISEEMIIAGTYISQEPHQLGTIQAQDYMRLIGLTILGIGCVLTPLGIKFLYDILGV